MKKTRLAIVLVALCFVPMLTIVFSPAAKASPAPASYEVKVDHVVEIRESGLLIINDTVRLPKSQETDSLQNFMLGFPYAHQSNLVYAFAYETTNPNTRLKLELDASMGRIGFYGINVVFPPNRTIYEFTVVTVFSNTVSFSVFTIEEKKEIMYNASFPAYPSLTQSASEANLTMVFPKGFRYTSSSFESEGINFRNSATGSKQYYTNVTSNLSEFTDKTGWFAVTKQDEPLELFEINEVKRDIKFLGLEQIAVSDSYKAMGKVDQLGKIRIKLPKEAFDISLFDDFGSIPTTRLNIKQLNTHTDVNITFARPYDKGEEARFSASYKLPWKSYVNLESWSDFHVSITLLENFDWTIKSLTTTIVLPEGATLLSPPSSAGLSNIQNDAFRNSFTFVYQNVTPFQNLSFDFKYGRVIFWESFRPTLWMSALVTVIGAIIGAWRVYRPPAAPLPTAIIRVRVEELRGFVDLYDEKRRYLREIEALEARARKGKIPRRRYKVRKMTIESRLSSVSRDLAAMREKIRIAGPRYADLMRQLEVAETELQSVEADINRTEIRYRRGEISAAAHHKLLEDSYRRRTRAKTTIDGVLLRLREEIS